MNFESPSHESVGRRKSSWKSLVLLLCAIGFIASAVIAGSSFVRRIQSSTAFNSYHPKPTPSTFRSLLRPGSFEESTGDFVFLNDVRLHQGPAPYLYLATGAAGKQILIEFQDSKFLLRTGKPVDVRGLISKMPSQRVARRQWKLDKSDWQQIATNRVYIVAENIEMASTSKQQTADAQAITTD